MSASGTSRTKRDLRVESVSGAERKSHFCIIRSAFDPEPTSGHPEAYFSSTGSRPLPSDEFGRLDCCQLVLGGGHAAAGIHHACRRCCGEPAAGGAGATTAT